MAAPPETRPATGGTPPGRTPYPSPAHGARPPDLCASHAGTTARGPAPSPEAPSPTTGPSSPWHDERARLERAVVRLARRVERFGRRRPRARVDDFQRAAALLATLLDGQTPGPMPQEPGR